MKNVTSVENKTNKIKSNNETSSEIKDTDEPNL